MRILIVEDDDRIAKPLAEYLRRQHHIVDITTDGLEGWGMVSVRIIRVNFIRFNAS